MTSIGIVREKKKRLDEYQGKGDWGLNRQTIIPANPIPSEGTTVPKDQPAPIGYTSPAREQPTRQAGVAEKAGEKGEAIIRYREKKNPFKEDGQE